MKIRVIKVPEGDPPYWVRKDMLDLEFTTEPDPRARELLEKTGASPAEIGMRVYIVVTLDEVLRALRESRRFHAAFWFEQNELGEQRGIVIFERKFCI